MSEKRNEKLIRVETRNENKLRDTCTYYIQYVTMYHASHRMCGKSHRILF